MRLYHITNGRAYGPANPGESLEDYRKRVKAAYGNLRGVRFVSVSDDYRHDPVYVVTGQAGDSRCVVH